MAENMTENMTENLVQQPCCPVDKVRRELLGEAEIGRMAVMFKMLSDPTRLKIINALMASELCVCDLAAVMGMSQSAVSHQLAALRTNRLIKSRREGKQIYYSLDDAHIGLLFDQCLTHAREAE